MELVIYIRIFSMRLIVYIFRRIIKDFSAVIQ